jgi:hypothetical protein
VGDIVANVGVALGCNDGDGDGRDGAVGDFVYAIGEQVMFK